MILPVMIHTISIPLQNFSISLGKGFRIIRTDEGRKPRRMSPSHVAAVATVPADDTKFVRDGIWRTS